MGNNLLSYLETEVQASTTHQRTLETWLLWQTIGIAVRIWKVLNMMKSKIRTKILVWKWLMKICLLLVTRHRHNDVLHRNLRIGWGHWEFKVRKLVQERVKKLLVDQRDLKIHSIFLIGLTQLNLILYPISNKLTLISSM